jgi:hypothetical protein
VSSVIARRLRVSVRSVQRWRRAWAEGGQRALRSQGPASLPRLSEKQFAQLEAELAKGPAAHGWEDQRWTLSRLKTVIGRRTAIHTHYPPTPPPAGRTGEPAADALVGRRMPDVDVTVEGSDASRVYELFAPGRFVLLDLTGERGLREDIEAGRGGRIDTAVISEHDAHPELMGASEVLVRPDGHVAWVHRGAGAPAPRAGRAQALAAWAGRPAEKSSAAPRIG